MWILQRLITRVLIVRMQKIRQSIFFFMGLVFSILLIFAISISNWVTINSFLKTLRSKEVQIQDNLLRELNTQMDTKYQNIFDLMISLHNRDGLGDKLGDYLADNEAADYLSLTREIKNLLQTVISGNSALEDIILIAANKDAFHYSVDSTRSLKPNYSWENDSMLENYWMSNKFISILSDNPSRYLRQNSENCITLLSRIYDRSLYPQKKVVATLIINYSIAAFDKLLKYDLNTDYTKFYVLNKDKTILYSTDHSQIGNTFSSYQNIINQDKYIIKSTYNNKTEITTFYIISKVKMWKQINRLKIQIIISVIISVLLALTVIIMFSIYFYRKLHNVIQYMEKLEDGDFSIRIPVKKQDEIGHLSQVFNEMCEKIENYIEMVYASELKLKRTELNFLQSQINPHFLYNTLESIRMTAVEQNAETTSEMIAELGNLFRWSTRTNQDFIRIDDEIEYIKSYLQLQTYRFDENLTYFIGIQDEVCGFRIPKLILQPIVENSIIHGFSSNTQLMEISVTGKLENGLVVIKITDNGTGFTPEGLNSMLGKLNQPVELSPSTSMGIPNVQQRIQAYFGKEYGLEIISCKFKGTTVKVVFPAKPWEKKQDNK